MFRSPYPDVVLPAGTLTEVVFGRARNRLYQAALVDATTGRALTYGDLLDRVRRVAAGLAALGIRKGDVVLLTSPNSPEFAVVFHAVAILGAIVSPANPANTSHEIAHQLLDAGATLAVTTAALADKVRAAIDESRLPVELVTIDDAPGTRSLAAIERDADPPAVAIDPAQDVVVLPYSSGTTGLPKGVMLTHRNLIANLVQIDAVEQTRWRAIVGVLPFFHIYGMVVILNLGLMRGATVVTLPRFELEPFLKVLQDWRDRGRPHRAARCRGARQAPRGRQLRLEPTQMPVLGRGAARSGADGRRLRTATRYRAARLRNDGGQPGHALHGPGLRARRKDRPAAALHRMPRRRFRRRGAISVPARRARCGSAVRR